MKTILFATGNPTKAKRFSDGLLKNGIEVITLKDINTEGISEPEENGKNSIENALIKARAYYDATKLTTIGMDDSLYLENVPEEKQPGMFVRRINGKKLSDEEMIKHYINLVKEYGNEGKITARWVYGMAIINNGKESTYTWSKEDFYLVDTPCDEINPGYPLNSISINKKLNKYFAQMTKDDWLSVKEDESNVVNFITEKVFDTKEITR